MATPRTGKPVGRTPKPAKRALAADPKTFEGLTPPETFSPYATELWHHLWSAGKGHLAPTQDRLIVEKVCAKLDIIRQLDEWLSVDIARRWYTTANGQTVTHPAVKQVEQADAQATAWLSMLGFSPSDRSRLRLPNIDKSNEFRLLHDCVAARRAGLQPPIVDGSSTGKS